MSRFELAMYYNNVIVYVLIQWTASKQPIILTILTPSYLYRLSQKNDKNLVPNSAAPENERKREKL